MLSSFFRDVCGGEAGLDHEMDESGTRNSRNKGGLPPKGSHGPTSPAIRDWLAEW